MSESKKGMRDWVQEYARGRISRREFVERASVAGFGLFATERVLAAVDQEKKGKPAAAAEHPVAHQRDVVVPPDRLEAVGAARPGGPQEALFQRQPCDADVQEAADDGPDDEDGREPKEHSRDKVTG